MSPTEFHEDFYVLKYGEPFKKNETAEAFWKREGLQQNEQPNFFFDPAYYIKKHGPANLVETPTEAWEHWCRTGCEMGLDGSAYFDAMYYLDIHDDLRDLGWSAAQAYEHYWEYGIAEGRKGSPLTKDSLKLAKMFFIVAHIN